MDTEPVGLHAQAKETTIKGSKSQDLQEEIVGQSPHGAEGEAVGSEEGVDIISSLPEAVLGEIVFLLPTKDGARTQILSFWWRHVWRSAPLNLDHTCLFVVEDALVDFISGTIAAHQGSVRRMSVPERYLFHRTSAVKAWLRSPALVNLQELEFYSPPLPRFQYNDKWNSLHHLRLALLGSPTSSAGSRF